LSRTARGINDYTPLHLAVSQCDEEAMELLLTHGADPSLRIRIDSCATAMEEADVMGNAEGAAYFDGRCRGRLMDEAPCEF
jgi:ankyrin repeat protein